MIPWPLDSPLSIPLAKRAGIGRLRVAAFAKKGLITSLDLLLVPPAVYRDRRQVLTLADAEDHKDIVFIGKVVSNRQGISAKGRAWLRVEVVDGDDKAVIWWFQNNFYFSQLAHVGATLLISGPVFVDRLGQASLTHPEVCRAEEAMENFLGVKPLYRSYPGVPQTVIKKVLAEILKELPNCPKVLPADWLMAHNLPDPVDLLGIIHNPPPNPGTLPPPTGSRAYRRLATYELMFWRLLIMTEKQRRLTLTAPRERAIDEAVGAKFLGLLPFSPTSEQLKATAEFVADLREPKPVNRLLQGEVGSGKTVVAGFVASLVLAQGRQVALLAPTELLARQHHDSLSPILAKMGFNPALLTGTLAPKEKKPILEGLRTGTIDFVVGTQALISSAVAFKDLALAIIDEQQRFGVRQRLALTQKSPEVDLMSLSATPIPRSLAQILYGDLDVTSVHGTIPGRKISQTIVFEDDEAAIAYDLFLSKVRKGEQGFVVCPRVGPEEEEEEPPKPKPLTEEERGTYFLAIPDELPPKPTRDVSTVLATLKAKAPDLRIASVHGRQDPATRGEAMASFREGRLDILVATTIIEVGVDVPGANLMLVESADFFGLSQLHQLRGRIGRGGGQGYFLAISSAKATPTAQRRLKALVESADGFKLAEIDLTLRGPGEELGLKQSGWPVFSCVKLPKDLALLPGALELADELWPKLKDYPDLFERLNALAKDLAVLPTPKPIYND
ncbi:MAG: DEAD/DEAH box helicase [Deltaproteobacteria bacterium]|nr:DEAD/DEAH box helicase [Deltaproteobacteria bacterium]